jgi:hypothetical protein
MALVSLQIVGLDKLVDQLGNMKGAGNRAANKSFMQWGLDVMVEAQMRTPVDLDVSHHLPPGTLRDSAEISVTPGDDLGLQASQLNLSFGGDAWEYAVVQHERLDFNHRVGQAKYLESAVVEALVTLGDGLRNEFTAEIEDAM